MDSEGVGQEESVGVGSLSRTGIKDECITYKKHHELFLQSGGPQQILEQKRYE